ncbi:flavin-containing monooxygenase [Chitinophaga hostae]|uniref:flavin-containing monooxygenase n=1 Tax=Chitinophaga hostae TaxID=2831022 RepID=UPI003F6A1F1A
MEDGKLCSSALVMLTNFCILKEGKQYYVQQTNTLIIGASIAGLASAASLQKKGITYVIIEKESQVATPWRNHYHRLHLHTSKRLSSLPYKKFDKTIPRYPARQQVVDYLDDYQRTFNIQPVFNTNAVSIKKEDDQWITTTNNGIFRSRYVIMATGAYGKPRPIDFKGIDSFPGKVLHSSGYKTGKDFQGQRLLVVGFGNSACEIAIDLYEQHAIPAMSVRSAVNVIPRDVFGIPVLELSLLMNYLPPRVADTLNAPLINRLVGDITALGLKKKPYGPLEQVQREGNAPVLDIGTIRHIREGHIQIFGDIDHIAGNTVYFSDGRKAVFDAIVAAIGYYRDYAEIVQVDKNRFTDLQLSAGKQQYFGKDGLYFCGYWVSPTGQFREIGLDAKKIAADIVRRERNG